MGGQIELFSVCTKSDGGPVWCVEHLGEVLRISVLPPPHLGLVGVVYPADIAAPQRVAGIRFFVVCALAKAPISNAKNGFGSCVGAPDENRTPQSSKGLHRGTSAWFRKVGSGKVLFQFGKGEPFKARDDHFGLGQDFLLAHPYRSEFAI